MTGVFLDSDVSFSLLGLANKKAARVAPDGFFSSGCLMN